MARWRKRFEAWRTAKAPIPVTEVESLLKRVFGDRLTVHEGGSHRWTIEVTEIRDQHTDFQFGLIGLPITGGSHVKAHYCRVAYRAAIELGLFEEQ